MLTWSSPWETCIHCIVWLYFLPISTDMSLFMYGLVVTYPAKCNPSAYKGQITASKSETKEGNTFSQGGVLLVCHKDRPVIPNSHALRAHAEVEVSCCSGTNVFQPIQDTGGWFGCLCTNPASAIGGLGEGRRLPCYVFSCPEQLNRWPCHSLTDSVTEWVTFDFDITEWP